MLWRPLELAPELASGQPKEVSPSLFPGALVEEQGGKQRTRGTPHQFARGVFSVARDQGVKSALEFLGLRFAKGHHSNRGVAHHERGPLSVRGFAEPGAVARQE